MSVGGSDLGGSSGGPPGGSGGGGAGGMITGTCADICSLQGEAGCAPAECGVECQSMVESSAGTICADLAQDAVDCVLGSADICSPMCGAELGAWFDCFCARNPSHAACGGEGAAR